MSPPSTSASIIQNRETIVSRVRLLVSPIRLGNGRLHSLCPNSPSIPSNGGHRKEWGLRGLGISALLSNTPLWHKARTTYGRRATVYLGCRRFIVAIYKMLGVSIWGACWLSSRMHAWPIIIKLVRRGLPPLTSPSPIVLRIVVVPLIISPPTLNLLHLWRPVQKCWPATIIGTSLIKIIRLVTTTITMVVMR